MAKFIQSDYDTAVKCSNELKTQAQEIRALIKSNSNMENASQGYWKGNSGDEMREGLRENRKRLESIAKEMESLANDIVTVAKKLKEKDNDLSDLVGSVLSKFI